MNHILRKFDTSPPLNLWLRPFGNGTLKIYSNFNERTNSQYTKPILITDLNLLRYLARSAYWAREAACLKPREDSVGSKIHVKVAEQPKNGKAETGSKEIYVYFYHESLDIDYWETRENLFLTLPKGGGLKIDRFFWEKFRNVRKPFLQKMAPFIDSKANYTFTGFGNGGAVAILAGLAFRDEFQIDPVLVTFGAPRLSNEHFVRWVSNQFKIYRVTYSFDTIPGFPSGYRQHPTEYWIPEQEECQCQYDNLNEAESFPKVFKCLHGENFLENPACNAQMRYRFRDSHQKFKSNFNRGPYFGYLMGRCPHDS
ncbi:hypothetical protein G9A89_011206 [Geosiphon pyriformis]|nr:hypothetical protein G9A89_011206 [Geosiphon pyriformis]